MKVQILRKPDFGDLDLPVGAVINLPPLLARALTGTGEAIEAPFSAVTHSFSLVSGAGKSDNLSNMLSLLFDGRFTTAPTSGNPHTTQYQFGIEAYAYAVRLIPINSVNAVITGLKAAVSGGSVEGVNGSNDAINPALNGGGLINVTWGGSTTCPNMAAAPDVNSIVLGTPSDIIPVAMPLRTDGGVQPILFVRLELDGAANANRPAFYFSGLTGWESSANTAGRIRRIRSQAVAGVTTPANFTAASVSNFNGMPCIVQYFCLRPGLTYLAGGNSIFGGTGETTVGRRGWVNIARDLVSTLDRPIEICQASIAGANSATIRQRVQTMAPVVKADFILAAHQYDVNDQPTPMTSGSRDVSRGNYLPLNSIARAAGSKFVGTTGMCSSAAGKALGVGDIFRRAQNTETRALLPQPGALIELSTPVEGAINGSNQQEFAPDKTDDWVHPNGAGHAAVAQYDSQTGAANVMRYHQSVNLPI